MYPNITLEIDGFTPQILYKADKNTSKPLIEKDENLAMLINPIAEELNLLKDLEYSTKEDLLAQLLKLSAEGEQYPIDALPKGIEKTSGEFGLESLITKHCEELISKKENFDNLKDIKQEIIDELNRNQNIDILSTLLDYIYYILISKTLFHATDLGIGKFYLDDKSGLLRFQEIMAYELHKLDLELVLI